MDMRIVDKSKLGIVRPLPRWAEATQRRSLASEGFDHVVNLAEDDDNDVLSSVRARDTVAVYLLHVLAHRELPGINPRTSLFWWTLHLVQRRAVIVETATGRRADTAQIGDIPILLEMLGEAVETVTRGTKGRAVVRRAQENGAKSEGRPRFDPTRNRALVEAVHYAKPDKRLTGHAYIDRLRRLGWSRSKAFHILGPRSGR
jgi:hypothetical protein